MTVAAAAALAGLVAGGPSGARALSAALVPQAPATESAAVQRSPGAGKPAEGASVTLDELHQAIDHLGAFEDAVRQSAARTVRRAPGPMALVALTDAADRHADGYVRYRALVLLSGYGDPRVRAAMERARKMPNDRLRAVAYEYFEQHPEPALLPVLLAAFDGETAEFVRPSLARALAAQGADPQVQQVLTRDVMRGQDFFRSTVIEALGDYKATYAEKAIGEVARLDGPLQDDATLALGRIGDMAALSVLAELQHTAPQENQPVIAAAICLLGVNCETQRGYLIRTLTFADKVGGHQELLRSAATALGAIAETGDTKALDAIVDLGAQAGEAARAPLALALAAVAVKNPDFVLEALTRRQSGKAAITLLQDGFDMLEEDFAEEGFFVAIRRAYWAAPEGSAARATAQALIDQLGF
jgi:HEAT repeat protein